MKEVRDRIYIETGYVGANVGCIATDEGAILIDTPMIPADAWKWLRRVARIAKGGLAYLINTDYHSAHVLGNCFFPAVIIGHELTWHELKTHGEATLQRFIEEQKIQDPRVAADLVEARVVAPEVTISDKLNLYKGNRAVEVIFLGGHTPASIGVYVADAKTLFAGDVVVTDRHPDLSQAQTEQWLQTLKQIRQMDVEVVAPGHGEPCGLEGVDALIAYIEEMRRHVESLYRGGASRRETVDKVRTAMLDRFPVLPERRDATILQIRSGIERIYEEIRKSQ
jgi:cyclase